MTGLEQGLVISFFGIATSAIIGLLVWMARKINDQAGDIRVLQTQVSPLWAQVQARISADLHHPNPKYHEMDRLLEKLEALTITPAERVRLQTLLVERSADMHPDITESQRQAAKVMIPLMNLVVIEAGENK